jgi:hypothetical protein
VRIMVKRNYCLCAVGAVRTNSQYMHTLTPTAEGKETVRIFRSEFAEK